VTHIGGSGGLSVAMGDSNSARSSTFGEFSPHDSVLGEPFSAIGQVSSNGAAGYVSDHSTKALVEPVTCERTHVSHSMHT
jgi:hypothetical protein